MIKKKKREGWQGPELCGSEKEDRTTERERERERER